MSRKKQLSNRQISDLCSQLGTIVASGISITDGLFILARDEEDKEYRTVLKKMLETLENSGTVSDAVKKTGLFPVYFDEMITVGEKTGRLDTVLNSMAEYYTRLDDISSSVKSAIVYPTVLLITVFAVIAVLAIYVLPIFSDVFAQLGLTMSDSAAWIMNVGAVISSVAVYVIGAVALLIILLVILYNSIPAVKKAAVSLVSHTKIAKNLYSARFTGALSMALSSGLDVDESMEMCEKLIESEKLRAKISECRRKMRDGKPFTEALGESGLFSSLNIKMINIAFSTGTLDTAMKRISEKDESRVSEAVNLTVSRLEPAMIIIMALAVGFILLSVMLPLLGIMTIIG